MRLSPLQVGIKDEWVDQQGRGGKVLLIQPPYKPAPCEKVDPNLLEADKQKFRIQMTALKWAISAPLH